MKFSIITPTYNRAHTIERAIKSILKQTYQDFEMIIIDDCSTDNTKDIVKRYLLDSRIRYIALNNNDGVNVARNIGLQNISEYSDWITFLDSDDEFLPDALDNMKKTIKENTDYNYFRFAGVYDNGEKACFSKYTKCVLDYKKTLQQVDVSGDWVALLHKSIISGFKFEEKVNGFEGLAWFSLSQNVLCMYQNIQVLLVYRDTEGLTRTSKDTKWHINYIKGLTLHLEKFGDDQKKYSKKEYVKKLYALGNSHFILSNYSSGWYFTFEAFKSDPFNVRIFRNLLTLLNIGKNF